MVNADIQWHIRQRLQHDRKLKWPRETPQKIQEILLIRVHIMYEIFIVPWALTTLDIKF